MGQHYSGSGFNLVSSWQTITWANTLRPRQTGRHFTDDIFKRTFLNGNVWILINISWRFVPRGPIDNIPALVQIMAWRRPGDKPLSEPMMVSLLTHICVTRPQWVNTDLDLCRCMTSLGYNDWMRPCPNIQAMIYTIFSHLWLYSFIDSSNITPVLIQDGRFSQPTISTLTKYPQMFVWAEQIATITLCYAMVSFHEKIHTYSVDTK